MTEAAGRGRHEGDGRFRQGRRGERDGKDPGFPHHRSNNIVLIQDVVNMVAEKGTVKSITARMHIFPAMSELIRETLRKHRKERGRRQGRFCRDQRANI